MKLIIRQTESYETYVVREGIEIDTQDFPALRELSDKDVIQYLKENSLDDVYPQPGTEWDTQHGIKLSLQEILGEQDIVRDKILNDVSSVIVQDPQTHKEL